MVDDIISAIGGSDAIKNLFGGIFNSGSSSDIKWRAEQLKSRPVDDPKGWPPKDGTFLDFFINFIDDYSNLSVPVASNGGRAHPEWIAALFTPKEWDSVVEKVVSALPLINNYAPDWNVTNVRYNLYDSLVMPWVKKNIPQQSAPNFNLGTTLADLFGQSVKPGVTQPDITNTANNAIGVNSGLSGALSSLLAPFIPKQQATADTANDSTKSNFFLYGFLLLIAYMLLKKSSKA